MKILHVLDSDGMYGAEVMLLNLVMEQQQLGHDPIILSIEDTQNSGFSLSEEAQLRGLSVVKLETKRGFRISTSSNIIHYAKTNNFDILHSHGYKGNILIGIVPPRMRGIPALSTIHGWTSVSRFTRIWLYNLLDRYFLKKLDAIVFVNPLNTMTISHKSKYCVENGIPKISIDSKMLNPSDIDLIHPQNNRKFTIGCISRLSEEKGVANLIKAIALLTDTNISLQLVVVGNGVLEQELLDMTKQLGIEKQVIFLGYRNNAYNYLPLFDVFALPSLTEGLPITILEAMQAEVPIVATTVGALPQLLKDGKHGKLVPSNDPVAMAEALLEVKNSPEQAKARAIEARRTVLERYASDRMAKQYINIYQAVIRKWKQ